MIECVFCCSPSKDNYIYTECNHLICADCARNQWDGRYSLKCCNQLTFLSEETTEELSRSKINIRIEMSKSRTKDEDNICEFPTLLEKSVDKENMEQSYCQKIKLEQSEINKSMTPKQSYCQRIKLEQSELIRSMTPNKNPIYEEKERETALDQMEKILSDRVAEVKCNYEAMRKQLERKEQIMLKELYNTYSDHLNSLNKSCSEKDVDMLR